MRALYAVADPRTVIHLVLLFLLLLLLHLIPPFSHPPSIRLPARRVQDPGIKQDRRVIKIVFGHIGESVMPYLVRVRMYVCSMMYVCGRVRLRLTG